jgi:cytochrome c-type biogenesis protein CcmH
MSALVVVLAVVAAAALCGLLLPVLRPARALPGRAGYDAVVYRDQLAEVERDVARGLVSAEEAAGARLEIERRLLATTAESGDAAAASRRSPKLAATLAVLVVAGAAATYLKLGAPADPDLPFASRAASREAGHTDMAKLAATLHERLAANPADADGWELYARTEANLRNWREAAEAYRRRIALGGADAETEAAYGEMLALDAGGVVTPAARAAFGEALKSSPNYPVARYYLALGDAQDGHGQAAIAAWLKLAAETADPAMRAEIARRVANAARVAGVAAPPLPSGPDEAAMQAAAGMSPEAQAKMVRGMVDQLAARLAANPNDADGWMRLGRAYGVLSEADKAVDAYEKAAALRPADAEPLVQAADVLLQGAKPDQKLPARAIDLLRRAGAIDANRPEVLWYLGLADAEAGHPEAAQDRWRRLLTELPPDSADRKMVEQAIAAVGKK